MGATVPVTVASVTSAFLTHTSFFNDPATTEIYTLSLHDALPISVFVSDLVIAKTDGSSTYTPGRTVTYTITVTNRGPSDFTRATVTDSIPATLTRVTWTSSSTGSASVSSGATGSGNSLAAAVNIT